jgi:hypothetical protein
MSFPRFAAFGVFPLLAGLSAACSSSTVENQTGGTTGGMGGASTSASTSTGKGGSTGATTTTGSSGDGAEGTPSNTYPASFPTPPQVADFGGPVLASPKFVPVFFPGDDPTTVGQIEDFVNRVGQTSYWTAIVTEYGVGPGVGAPPVDLTETAPTTIDDSAIQTWLAGKLDGGDPLWPVADANTVYALHYPTGTTVTFQGGPTGTSTSCTDFGGYHSNITLQNGMNVAYAVIPRCPAIPAQMGFAGMSIIQNLTSTESHEFIEASTDPYPQTDAAYADVESSFEYWEEALGGGEIGDMCAQFDGVFTTFPELPYMVQRSWSNKAALAGQDPCVPPLAGEVYFNAGPELDDIPVTIDGESLSVKGVEIPVGKSKTIMLDLFSNASTSGPFSVHVDDGNYLNGGPQLLSFSAPPESTMPCPTGAPTGSVCVGGENGQKIPVTITVMTAGQGNQETFWVVSYQNGDANENFWIGLVAN